MSLKLLLASSSAAVLISIAASPSVGQAQGILDQLGRSVERQLQRGIQRALPRVNPPGIMPQPSQPPKNIPQQNSIPNEGGIQNNPGFFDPTNFFGPPSNTVPSQPPGNRPPINTIPGTLQPGQYRVIQSDSYVPQSSTTSRTVIAEPPLAKTTDFNGKMIKLRCPSTENGAAKYKLVLGSNTFAYSMKPGEAQSFTEDRVWLVRYQSGSGTVTYRLRGGNTYSFSNSSSNGLQLFKEPEKPAALGFPEPPTRMSN